MNYIKNTDRSEIIYIFGAGHCGSTLLNVCLDQHFDVFGVSEIISLNRKKPGWSGNRHVLSNDFWSDVDKMMYKKSGKGLKDVPFNLRRSLPNYDQAINLNKIALETILEISGKKIISDASKNAKRLESLLQSPLFKVRVIYLVRDGRAIVHAYRRKYGSWWPGLFNLMSTDFASRRLMKKFGSKNWLKVRYEDMVTNLENTLREICNFVQIKFEQKMLYPDTSKFNGLGGNRLVKSPIKKIALDNIWEIQMPTSIRFLTTLIVSNYNKRHGYKKNNLR